MRLTTRSLTSVVLMCVALAACDVPATPASGAATEVVAAAEVARLQALGFRRTHGSLEDGLIRLAYSGPINGAALCGPRGAVPARIPARSTTADGRSQTITLDAFVTLSPGEDGVIQAGERDGLYVVSIVTEARAGAAATVEGITFDPGGQGSFRSGLTCRAA